MATSEGNFAWYELMTLRPRTSSSRASLVACAASSSTRRCFTISQARSIPARWVDDFNTERLQSSLGYATPAA